MIQELIVAGALVLWNPRDLPSRQHGWACHRESNAPPSVGCQTSSQAKGFSLREVPPRLWDLLPYGGNSPLRLITTLLFDAGCAPHSVCGRMSARVRPAVDALAIAAPGPRPLDPIGRAIRNLRAVALARCSWAQGMNGPMSSAPYQVTSALGNRSALTARAMLTESANAQLGHAGGGALVLVVS